MLKKKILKNDKYTFDYINTVYECRKNRIYLGNGYTYGGSRGKFFYRRNRTGGDLYRGIFTRCSGNIGSNSTSINMDDETMVAPNDIIIEVGEKKEINFVITGYLTMDSYSLYISSSSASTKNNIRLENNGLHAKIEGLIPGLAVCRQKYMAHLNNPDGSTLAVKYGDCFGAKIYVIPNAPTLTSITNKEYQYDCIHYTLVKFAETYDLYRLREGIDTDYQRIATFKNDGSGLYTIEHPADGRVYHYKMTAKAAHTSDVTVYPNELYYPTSRFSNVLTVQSIHLHRPRKRMKHQTTSN